MTDQESDAPPRITVPGPPPDGDAEFAGLVNSQDLGSASRSCLAIIIVLLIIGLLLCVFLIGAIVT